jgi:hypothetical protein
MQYILGIDKYRHSIVAGRGRRRVFKLRDIRVRRSRSIGVDRDREQYRHVISRAVPRPQRHSEPNKTIPSRDPTNL